MAAPPLIAKLRDLHTKAKAGELDAHDRAQYVRLRAELMRVATAAQAASARAVPGRVTMRAALMLKVEIAFPDHGQENATTVDVSEEGFAALLAFAPGIGVIATFAMKSASTEALRGSCRVVGVTKQGALLRVSFTFQGLDAGAREQVEVAMLDALLLRFPT